MPDIGDLDAQTLAAMMNSGAVLTNQRNIRHYLYGRDEAATRPAAARLEAEGYRVQSGAAANGAAWRLLAEREEVVDAASIASARRLFEDLVSAMDGGDYDGWEAEMVEN